ncbi:hypothetical protein D3C84_984550 [compost metagenome]
MHLKTDTVLVEAVQRVARGDANRADVGQVVDHQLQDLALDRLLRRGDKVGEGEHRGANSKRKTAGDLALQASLQVWWARWEQLYCASAIDS